MQGITNGFYGNKQYRRTLLAKYYGMPDMFDIMSFIGKVFNYIKNRFYLVRNVWLVIMVISLFVIELGIPP